MEKMNIVIPMAGAGKRFELAGFKDPKPLIMVNGKPMIEVVLENLKIDGNYIFIVQSEHNKKYNLKEFLSNICPKSVIVEIDGLTDGAARTVLLSEGFINNDYPLLICNSDQWIEWDSNKFLEFVTSENLDGSVLTFNSDSPKHSYAKIENELVIEFAEKKVISNDATVGIYYWKKGSEFVKCAYSMIEKNIRTNNEFYICPVYNELIQKGGKIKTFRVSKMLGMGTPEELNNYLNEIKI